MLGNKIDVSGAVSEADLGTIFALNERTTGTVSRRSICIIYNYYIYIYNCERSELPSLFNARIFYIIIIMFIYFRPYVVP